MEHHRLNKTLLEEEETPQEAVANPDYEHPNVTVIAAASENDALGKDNDLLWHIREDLQRFKDLTCGHAIIMGRKTFESLPKALPNRTNIIITRNNDYQATGIVCCSSLEEALDLAKDDPQPFIIGGGQIYQQAMPFAHTLELTRVHDHFEADTFFPTIDPTIWQEVWRETHPKSDNQPLAYTFITYKKIATS